MPNTDDKPKRGPGRPRKSEAEKKTPTRKGRKPSSTPTRTRKTPTHTPTQETPTPTPTRKSEENTPYTNEGIPPVDVGELAPVEDAKPVKKKDGRGNTTNFPNMRNGLGSTMEDKLMIGAYIRQVCKAFNMPRVKSDEELIQRIDEYFEMCAEAGQFPTMEEVQLYTGYHARIFKDWIEGKSKGFSPETAKIAAKVSDMLKSIDAKLVISGKMNPIPYIFRAKNYYGMSDKTEHVITANPGDNEDMSAEEIARRYIVEDDNSIETTPDSVE